LKKEFMEIAPFVGIMGALVGVALVLAGLSIYRRRTVAKLIRHGEELSRSGKAREALEMLLRADTLAAVELDRGVTIKGGGNAEFRKNVETLRAIWTEIVQAAGLGQNQSEGLLRITKELDDFLANGVNFRCDRLSMRSAAAGKFVDLLDQLKGERAKLRGELAARRDA
jgi:hypothetical protein